MHILKAGKASFLEFLRNLTPQVLLATLSLLAFGNVATTRPCWENFGLTVLGAVFTIVLLLAALANSIQFIVNYHLTHPDLREHVNGAEVVSIGELQTIAREHKHPVWPTIFLLLAVVEIILLGALAMAGYNAISIVAKA